MKTIHKSCGHISGQEANAKTDIGEVMFANFHYKYNDGISDKCGTGPSDSMLTICTDRQTLTFDYTVCSDLMMYSSKIYSSLISRNKITTTTKCLEALCKIDTWDKFMWFYLSLCRRGCAWICSYHWIRDHLLYHCVQLWQYSGWSQHL